MTAISLSSRDFAARAGAAAASTAGTVALLGRPVTTAARLASELLAWGSGCCSWLSICGSFGSLDCY